MPFCTEEVVFWLYRDLTMDRVIRHQYVSVFNYGTNFILYSYLYICKYVVLFFYIEEELTSLISSQESQIVLCEIEIKAIAECKLFFGDLSELCMIKRTL